MLNAQAIPYVPTATRDSRIHQSRERNESLAYLKMADRERSLRLDTDRKAREVIRIQLLWRGYKTRTDTCSLFKEKQHWTARRKKDAHRRSMRTYSFDCCLGKGPLLESDTPRETVLKRVPTWAHQTLLDVVKDRYVQQATSVLFFR
mmetsp:Transcript_31861/g.95818  ORF Transcript_31861/g.95818 Transcript_31861/m.95818 type:complete len:147 (+) Transcript_31861:3151-3591(+)